MPSPTEYCQTDSNEIVSGRLIDYVIAFEVVGNDCSIVFADGVKDFEKLFA